VSHISPCRPPSRIKKVFASYFLPYRMGEKSDGVSVIGINVNVGRGGGAEVKAGSTGREEGVGVLRTSTVKIGFCKHAARLKNKTKIIKDLIALLISSLLDIDIPIIRPTIIYCSKKYARSCERAYFTMSISN
jgi:hypothetical protein